MLKLISLGRVLRISPKGQHIFSGRSPNLAVPAENAVGVTSGEIFDRLCPAIVGWRSLL